MSDSVGPQHDRLPDRRSYSSNLRNLLFGAALLAALFPIPVTAFGLLPTYQQHARFLILYTPLICLLAVGYLFYIRDSLARVLFADLIGVHTDYYNYQPESARFWGKLRRTLVALLPVLLLCVSFFCFTTYTRLFSESVEITTAVVSGPVAPRNAPDPAGSHAPPAIPIDPDLSRAEVLRTADLDSIEMFSQLTALYMGIFVAAAMAIVVMALKEHAAVAMGLSEQALLLREWTEEQEEEPEYETEQPTVTAPPPPVMEPPKALPSAMDMLAQEVAGARAKRAPSPDRGIQVPAPRTPEPQPPATPNPASAAPIEPPGPASPPPPEQPTHRRRYSMEPPERNPPPG